MSLLQGLLGNVSEVEPEKVKEEFGPIFIEGEEIQRAYVLIRDMLIFTNYRVISLDKQGMTGKKQELMTIPYKSIDHFSKVSAGMMDWNAELHISVKGRPAPYTFQFSKGVDVNSVYQLLSYYVIAT